MTRGPAGSLMSADGAQRFLRRGQRETLVLGLLIGTLGLVGAALSLLPPASKAGSVLLGSAAVATYFLWFPIAWWAIRGSAPGTRVTAWSLEMSAIPATPSAVPAPKASATVRTRRLGG